MSTLGTSSPRRIAIIGGHIPRECGIATFTTDLAASLSIAYPDADVFVVALNDNDVGYDYPERVRFEINQDDLSSYRRAAEYLNYTGVDVVCLQHEFGIFGGPAGAHILSLLGQLSMPVVTTLHTIERNPSRDQQRVLARLIQRSQRLVVMSTLGQRMLQATCRVPDAKLDFIPHGTPTWGSWTRAFTRTSSTLRARSSC